MTDLTLSQPASAPYSLAPSKAKARPKTPAGDRGKKAEAAVLKALKEWAGTDPRKEFNRLLDSRAAQRIVKAAKADFDFFFLTSSGLAEHGLIEVKETRHAFRLAHDKLPQLLTLARRKNAGGRCFVLVHHSETGQWRAAPVAWLREYHEGASWDLRPLWEHPTPLAAMQSLYPTVFDR